MQRFECQIREMKWIISYKTCEEKCLAGGKKRIPFPAPLFSPSLHERGVTMETQRALSLLADEMKSE